MNSNGDLPQKGAKGRTKDYETTGPRDYETTGAQDNETGVKRVERLKG
jgi:hypothetical protein